MATRKKASGAAKPASKRSGGPAAKRPRAPRKPPVWKLCARPDAIDFRDRQFLPNIAMCPSPTLFPKFALPVKNQEDTNACTGFALSLVVEHALRASKRELEPSISPYMLYSMARRYDEFPGSVADEGSSLRGSLKGWFKHGACAFELFPGIDMPPAAEDIESDWWFDAVRRPLGAYYRIKTTQITDMHAALNEAGILYVSCGCHAGWDLGMQQPAVAERPSSFDEVWTIPVEPGWAAHAGHAFAIVGYNERGFLIQNSWGPEWGSHGYAILTYDDWLKNAMDCWVVQLGVVTQDHRELARTATLRLDQRGKVALAQSDVLRNRELSPFIINMGNNGALSSSGDFRTTPDDVRAIVDLQLERAREAWGLQQGTIDVCLYAHGGLVSEQAAAVIASQWIPMLYDRRIFPVFLMWETGFLSTLASMIGDAVSGTDRVSGGLERWWNQRLERVLARPGTAVWGEMKENADCMSRYREGVADERQAGAVLLYQHFSKAVKNKNVRMHYVGHSAGAIAGTYLVERLVAAGMPFESVSFLAPAVRLDVFEQRFVPLLAKGKVKRYQQFSLTDRAEEDDPTCGPYRRSLLYLVRESFEGGAPTPILGMERDVRGPGKAWPHTTLHFAPGPASQATTHGAFDNDPATAEQVLRFIAGQ
ncbi:C1 family peptidase [Aquincola sp. MAHUQ-54]|uniref:C1 family peptidase n=1 Tax=Aquincola agrisoli TaxID=3119538 RepID=A0AAW9QE43_9BURK